MITVRCSMEEWMRTGPALVAAGAEAVELENSPAIPSAGPCVGGGAWWGGDTVEEHCDLSPEVWSELVRTGGGRVVTPWVEYPTREAAITAANAAAFAWAKGV